MLEIVIPYTELWDEGKEDFIYVREQKLRLEHSLVSISKWESKWHKRFLSNEKKSDEETIDYIKCMTLTQNVDPLVYKCLTNKNISDIEAYIDDPMTATTIPKEENAKKSRENITSELIYYWMISFNIPFECRKWHLNQLLTLIEVCNVKNRPPKKRSQREIARRHAAINAAQRKRFNSKG